MNGIVLIDKPKGWTSFDVVAKVRSIVRSEVRKTHPGIKRIKVGHTGTLDPSATGLLVICIGTATKRVPDMIRHDKTYEVEMTLGSTSTTGDQEGEIHFTGLPDQPHTIEAVKNVLGQFLGEQMQTPPAYSAIKIDGKRAYELARAGRPVKLEPRPITIHSIEIQSYEYPKLSFVCSVSSGTYIRSLVEDIGERLGVGAYMSNLRRTKVDRFTVNDALHIDSGLSYEKLLEALHE